MPERDTMDDSLVNVSYICTDKSGFTVIPDLIGDLTIG